MRKCILNFKVVSKLLLVAKLTGLRRLFVVNGALGDPNDISKVPPPLLSRVEAFTVPAPQPGQRLRIIEQTMADLSQKTGHAIAFAPGVAERLAERMDIDLRQLIRLVRASFATALQAGDKVARIKAPDAIGPVGFSLRDWAPQQGPAC